MSDVSTRPPLRWQDGVDVALGALVALTPLWFAAPAGATWAMVALGVLVALGGLVSMRRPAIVYIEWAQMAFGFLLFIAPWVADYTDAAGAAWTSWVGGLLIALAGFTTLPEANVAQAGDY